MAEPVRQGPLTGRREPRPGACPTRDRIAIERDLPAKAGGCDGDPWQTRLAIIGLNQCVCFEPDLTQEIS
jgi:hypothetical protein